ncbi:MAG: LytTR family DNA-binding domain-containing protein [Christiangramia sp.]|uniref:LytR/AlgR family response regulator transcription factor n=1 Tax=Christiangramia sp. TaxID=1931228 RepID=UPI0032421694
MSLKCMIIDDEPHAIRLLEKYVDQLPEVNCVAISTKPVEALALLQQHQPDVLFLDIQMPDLTGIQLSKLVSKDVRIIFTTAYSQFAVEGFELNATDYLLKPISFPRFVEAVEKVKNQSSKTAERPAISEDYFFVKTDGKNNFRKIAYGEIQYLESIRNYVVIHLENEQVVTYNTLKHFEENLPEDEFVKIHKSFIISLSKITKTDSQEVTVANQTLPLGDTYRQQFFARINQRKI